MPVIAETVAYGTFDSTHPLWEAMGRRHARHGGAGAADYAMHQLGRMTGHWSPVHRMVLLALAHHFDLATWSGDGYNGTRPEDLTLFVGQAAGTIAAKLKALAKAGWCVREKRGNAYLYRPLEAAQQW